MREDWEIKKIIEVCEVISGQSPESKYYNKDGNGLPFFQGKKEFGEKCIGKPTTWTTKITKEAYNNDILMSVRAPVGPVNFATQHICIGRGLAAIRPGSKLNRNFLFYYLLKNESELENTNGAVFNSINRKQIGNIPIPIPPLSEQKQIVALLDKAFAAIDQAKANIEKNIENARELFQSKLDEVFTNEGDVWIRKKLKDVCQKTANIKWQSNNGNYEYIDLSSVSRDTLKVTDTKTISEKSAPSRAKKIIHENDVIFATTRPTLKRMTIIPEELSNQICSTGFVVLRSDVNQIKPEWIFYFLQTTNFMERMETVQRGTSYPAVTDRDVKNCIINFPESLNNQQEMITKLNDIKDASEEMISEYSQKIKLLEELKKSILEKAFNGELTVLNRDLQDELDVPDFGDKGKSD